MDVDSDWAGDTAPKFKLCLYGCVAPNFWQRLVFVLFIMCSSRGNCKPHFRLSDPKNRRFHCSLYFFILNACVLLMRTTTTTTVESKNNNTSSLQDTKAFSSQNADSIAFQLDQKPWLRHCISWSWPDELKLPSARLILFRIFQFFCSTICRTTRHQKGRERPLSCWCRGRVRRTRKGPHGPQTTKIRSENCKGGKTRTTSKTLRRWSASSLKTGHPVSAFSPVILVTLPIDNLNI